MGPLRKVVTMKLSQLIVWLALPLVAPAQAPKLSQWVEQLRSQKPEERISAIEALGKLGPKAKEAIPALVQAFQDREESVRDAAVASLVKIGPGVVPLVIVEYPREKTRRYNGSPRPCAARVLAEMGTDARDAVPLLIKDLGHRDYGIQTEARNALVKLGAVSRPALLETARDTSSTLASHALATLAKMGPEVAGDALPLMIKALEDRDWVRRQSAVHAIGQMGKAARAAVPALAKALSDISGHVGEGAARILGELGPDAKEAIPALISCMKNGARVRTASEALGKIGPVAIPPLTKALEDENRNVRRGAAQGLGHIGEPASKAAGALAEALRKDDERFFRQTVLWTLGRVKPSGKAPVAGLLEVIRGKNPVFRKQATDILGQLGKEAVPLLLEALGDKDAAVRASVVAALKNIGPEPKTVIEPLTAIIKNGDSPGRTDALAVLEHLQQGAKPAMATLAASLRDGNKDVRASAAKALGKVGPDALPLLGEALEDRNGDAREGALQALGVMGAAGKEALPALLKALKDRAVRVRRAAVDALEKVGGAPKMIVPALARVLKDTDADVRLAAAAYLGRLGTEAREAIPALLMAATDANVLVRATAIDALSRIDPEALKKFPEKP